MRNYLLIWVLTLASIQLSAQQKSVITRESDNFSGASWNWSRQTNDPIYNCFVTDQQNYYLSLPPGSWGFTYAGLPSEIRRIDDFANGELNFDFKVSTMVESRFSLGFLFDFHGVTDQCPGGDFYNLRIHGDSNYVTASIDQRKGCEYLEKATVPPTNKAKVNLTGYNHVSIKKNSERYETYINDVMVLTFEFKGALNLARLYWERGNYYLDNITINEVIYTSPQVNLSYLNTPNNQRSKPQIYVLAVGINIYDNIGFPQRKLKGSVNDATSMSAFWSSISGGAVDLDNISLLTDQDATVEKILITAEKLFYKAKENDVIVTFFSGHGGVGAFCAYDGALSYERINQIISKSSARKLCIVDACHAGTWNANSVLGQKGQMTSPEDALKLFYSRLASAGKGMNWLLACRPDEYSIDGTPNGVFTQNVLLGLNGKADQNEDSIITVGELNQFLNEQFAIFNNTNKDKVYDDGKRVQMNPQFRGDGNTSIPLAVLYKQ